MINNIRCDYCGKFISFSDIDSGAAIHQLDTPLSEFTEETYESICNKCLPKHHDLLKNAMQTIYGTSLVKF